jgi:hypothetical protein
MVRQTSAPYDEYQDLRHSPSACDPQSMVPIGDDQRRAAQKERGVTSTGKIDQEDEPMRRASRRGREP